MRLGIIAVLMVGSLPAAFSQRSLNTFGNNGNIINPGVPLTGPSPVTRGPAFGSLPSLGPLPTLGVSPIGGSVFGSQGMGSRVGGAQRGSGRGGFSRGFGGAIYVPVPVYGGGGVVHSPAPGDYDPIFGVYNPGVVYDNGYQAPQQTPTVIINQNFQPDTVHPVIHDYTNAQLPPPGRGVAPQADSRADDNFDSNAGGSAGAGDQQTIYLIAMKDHTIYPALAYWVEKDSLNYVTMQGVPNRVSLSLVDRDLSKRLNDERGLSFRLPATR